MPTQLSITEFFAGRLNAPLHNAVWSWGAVRPSDGVVFLRCWSDTLRRIDGQGYVEIQWPETEVRKSKPGWVERNRHIDLMNEGHRAYAVIVTAKNTNANPRQIAFFNASEVFELGAMTVRDGITYAQIVARHELRNVRDTRRNSVEVKVA